MAHLTDALSIFSIVLTVCSILGGILAFRNGFARTANEVQDRVINALEAELEQLRQRLDEIKDENTRLKLTIDTICSALKSRGMAVSIEGDMVLIHDHTGNRSSTRIRENAKKKPQSHEHEHEEEICPL
jgi:hypothetical protein